MVTYKVVCVGGVSFTVQAEGFGLAKRLGNTVIKGPGSVDWFAFSVEEEVVRYVFAPNVISIEIVKPSTDKSTKAKEAEKITRDMPRRRSSITDGF